MIQIEGAAKSYGGRVLFRDLTWRISGGERIGLVGPNGAGKTTLCRMLAGTEDLDEGRVVRARHMARLDDREFLVRPGEFLLRPIPVRRRCWGGLRRAP